MIAAVLTFSHHDSFDFSFFSLCFEFVPSLGNIDGFDASLQATTVGSNSVNCTVLSDSIVPRLDVFPLLMGNIFSSNVRASSTESRLFDAGVAGSQSSESLLEGGITLAFTMANKSEDSLF